MVHVRSHLLQIFPKGLSSHDDDCKTFHVMTSSLKTKSSCYQQLCMKVRTNGNTSS